MIDYLEQLVEDGKYDAAIQCAERIMLTKEYTAMELARIHCGLLISRYYTEQFYAATVSGQVAMRLALETEEWDTVGRCCLYLGVSYYRTGQGELAISTMLEFFHHLPFYSSSAKLEPRVWFNLGAIHTKRNDPHSAIPYLRRAEASATNFGDTFGQHAARHASVEAYMLKGEYKPIPKLMALSRRFLRKNADHPHAITSYLWHMILRATYALRRDRVGLAMAIAVKALPQSENRYYQQFHLRILLAELCMKKGLTNDAFTHSLLARVCAIKSNKYYLELQAMELIHRMTNQMSLDSITLSSELLVGEAQVNLFNQRFAQ